MRNLEDKSSMTPHLLLSILDCPVCRKEQGLVPQEPVGGQQFLACPLCRFWYPVRDEVIVLMVPERNPEGRRAELGPAVPLDLERRAGRFADLKLLAYSYSSRLGEFGRAFAVDRQALVVDVGCSTGSFAAWLRPEQTYVGLDMSFASLRFARRASGQFFVQADAERLPIKTGSVPFFVSRDLIEHLSDPLEGLRELCRAGRHGVIAVPTLDFPFLYDPLNWVLTRIGRRARFGVYGYGHQHLENVAGWRALVQRGGFRVHREQGIGSGLAGHAFDMILHGLYSRREFDHLPRRSAPLWLARAGLELGRALHGHDATPLSKPTVSRAFEVVRA
jgi:SAM-dependent methyltransferase